MVVGAVHITKSQHISIIPSNRIRTNTHGVEIQLQIGTKRLPAYSVQSLAGAQYSIQSTLGITNTGAGSAHISNLCFMADQCVLATDCENKCGVLLLHVIIVAAET